MSRNAHFFGRTPANWLLLGLLGPFSLPGQTPGSDLAQNPRPDELRARVVIVSDPEATDAFKPRREVVRAMVDRAITNLTGKAAVAAGWQSLVKPADVVGLKVYSAPGPNAGTRPAVVAAVVEGLLAAGIPTNHVLIWDKHRADLRAAGFYDVAARYGVRVEGSTAAGYDEKTYYDPSPPLLGPLLWSDLEYGREDAGAGRKSFATRLVSQEITRIINITPLLNHNLAGVTGNLYGLALGGVDNTFRFEMKAEHLAQAVPEIYALRVLSDRVVLNIVDALICQYEGQQVALLHYSTVLNELRFSVDPVALDVLSLQELERQRPSPRPASQPSPLTLYRNASLLELGVSDLSRIVVERFR